VQDYASLVFLILKFLVSHLVTPTSPSKLGPSQTSHQLNPALSLLAENEHDLHDLVDDLHAASSRFGLNSKTEVQCSGKDKRKMNIKLDTTELKQSDNFVYLGGVISADSSCDKDVARRIVIASGVVRNLDDIWKSKITTDTKVKLPVPGAVYLIVHQ